MRYSIQHQGHWWIESVVTVVRRPGLLVADINTEQKRPMVGAYTYGERDPMVIIEARPEGWGPSLGFREGEDGTESTAIILHLPHCLPWRKWEYRFDYDKWSVTVIAWTQKKSRWEYRWYHSFNSWLHKVRRKKL